MVDIMFEYWTMQQSRTGAFYNTTTTCAHCIQKFTAKERIERQESLFIIGGKQDKNLLYNLYYIIFFWCVHEIEICVCEYLFCAEWTLCPKIKEKPTGLASEAMEVQLKILGQKLKGASKFNIFI